MTTIEEQTDRQKEIIINKSLDFKGFHDFQDLQSSSTTHLQTFRTAKHKSIGEKIFIIKTLHQTKARLLRPPIEIKIWENLNLLDKKPQGIPPVQIHKENKSFYHMIFDIPFNNITQFAADLNKSKQKLLFCRLTQIFDNLINTMAFLQTLNICHQGINNDNIYIDAKTNQIYMIDLAMSFNKYPEDGISI